MLGFWLGMAMVNISGYQPIAEQTWVQLNPEYYPLHRTPPAMFVAWRGNQFPTLELKKKKGRWQVLFPARLVPPSICSRGRPSFPKLIWQDCGASTKRPTGWHPLPRRPINLIRHKRWRPWPCPSWRSLPCHHHRASRKQVSKGNPCWPPCRSRPAGRRLLPGWRNLCHRRGMGRG